jgi:hypothetical protein
LAYFALVSSGVAFVRLTDRRPELVIRVKVGLVDPREDSLPRQPLAPLNTLVGHASSITPRRREVNPRIRRSTRPTFSRAPARPGTPNNVEMLPMCTEQRGKPSQSPRRSFPRYSGVSPCQRVDVGGRVPSSNALRSRPHAYRRMSWRLEDSWLEITWKNRRSFPRSFALLNRAECPSTAGRDDDFQQQGISRG